MKKVRIFIFSHASNTFSLLASLLQYQEIVIYSIQRIRRIGEQAGAKLYKPQPKPGLSLIGQAITDAGLMYVVSLMVRILAFPKM